MPPPSTPRRLEKFRKLTLRQAAGMALLVPTPPGPTTISCGRSDFWLGNKSQRNLTKMKVLLQHTETGFYLNEAGVTTEDRAQAMEFLSSTQAIEFCMARKIADMQIVLRFDEQQFDIVLPMKPPPRALHSRAAHAA